MTEMVRTTAAVCKRVLRFGGKAFFFGLACALVLGACAAVISYYQNRAVSAKTWPVNVEEDFGMVITVRTEWRDGQAKYELRVTPSKGNTYLPFAQWKSSETQDSFQVTLKDPGGFKLEGCATDEIPLSEFVAESKGSSDNVRAISHEGEMPLCERSKYLSAVSISPTWRFAIRLCGHTF